MNINRSCIRIFIQTDDQAGLINRTTEHHPDKFGHTCSWILQRVQHVPIKIKENKHMIQIVKQCSYILTCLILLPLISQGNSKNTPPLQQDFLAEPVIRKVEITSRDAFQRRFRNIKWTGAGFQGSTVIDQIPTTEIRARLQKHYGDPTQKLKHLIYEDNFRPGHYIQFEYWFVINDEIPMMILDIDGPFGNGLVFAGASKYVDLMPEIKRTLTRKLMEVGELGEYEDHYYEMNDRQWYLVQYRDGNFENIKIERPGTLK